MNAGKATIQDLLFDLDGLFDGLLAWLAGQYDERSGGFYYARSSRLLAGRVADMESTAQALNMLERLRLTASMRAYRGRSSFTRSTAAFSCRCPGLRRCMRAF
ncbi:hypothetical protein [Paenibacillus harenae]|uniref:hypothetical protein n=1 Tax=Paenibacillus harenae TaxID=306543 RepID=UPI0003F7673C|nr:hypothetical protein [Paenibacillus harenae]